MDYKKVLRLHYVTKMSSREIATACSDCSKTSVNDFLRRFRTCSDISYPLADGITNEYIEGLLYRKPGSPLQDQLYRDFDREAVYKALAHKGETLKHLWQKYTAMGIVDGKRPLTRFSSVNGSTASTTALDSKVVKRIQLVFWPLRKR
jgi:hypothetical protein